MPESRINAAVCAIGTKHFKYDTVTNKWSTCAHMPAVFGSGSMCTLNGKLYIVGGVRGNLLKDTMYVYDTETDS